MLRNITLVYLLLLASILLLPLCAVCQDDTVTPGTLTVITDFDSPPFSFRDKLTPAGFEIELVTALARELGSKLVWKEMTFDPEIFARCLDTKVADAAVASITITPGRLKMVAFTRPYFVSGQAVAVVEKAEWKDGGIVEALKGKRLGAMDRTTGEAYARENFKGAELQAYHTADSLARALQAGWVDAIILDEDLLSHLAAQRSFKFRVVARNLTREEYGIAVSKSNPDLIARLDAALEKIGKSGEYSGICEKWFGHKAALPPQRDR